MDKLSHHARGERGDSVVSGFRHYVVKAFGLLALYVAYFECWVKDVSEQLISSIFKCHPWNA